MPEQGTGNREIHSGVVKSIIEYLNQKTGKAFKSTTDKTKNLIVARIKEGYAESDFKKVIELKSTQWAGTENDKYLRPETLFGNKFEGYLNERSTNRKKQQIQNLTNANDVK